MKSSKQLAVKAIEVKKTNPVNAGELFAAEEYLSALSAYRMARRRLAKSRIEMEKIK